MNLENNLLIFHHPLDIMNKYKTSINKTIKFLGNPNIFVFAIAWMIILVVILIVVTLVLWNMGIMNGLRRYGEIGMRLAIGETKGHVFKSMVIESLIIAMIGSIFGTVLGITVTTYFERVGLDYSKAIDSLSSSNFAMPNIFYPQVTPELFYIGFIPGILATVFGTMLAGRAIYKREMAQLFKELEI